MNEKILMILWRVVALVIYFIAILLMFVVNPGENQDKFSAETLWEAVHPYTWWADTLGIAGLTFFMLYVSGLAGKVIYTFTEPKSENSSGLIHFVGGISFLLILMFML